MILHGSTEILTGSGNVTLDSLGVGSHQIKTETGEIKTVTISTASGTLGCAKLFDGHIDDLYCTLDTQIKDQDGAWININDFVTPAVPPVPPVDPPEHHIEPYIEKKEVEETLRMKLGYLHGRCNYDIYMFSSYAGCEMSIPNSETDVLALFEIEQKPGSHTYAIVTAFEESIEALGTDNSPLEYRLLPRSMGEWEQKEVDDYMIGFMSSRCKMASGKMSIFARRYRLFYQIEEMIENGLFTAGFNTTSDVDKDEYTFNISGFTNMVNHFERYGVYSNLKDSQLTATIKGTVPLFTLDEEATIPSGNMYTITKNVGETFNIVLNKRAIVKA